TLEDFDRFDLAFAPFLDPAPIEVDPEDGVLGIQTFNLGITENEFDTDAIFARIAYETADARWRFSAEARYQDEEKTLTNLRGATPIEFNDSWSSFTPRFTVDYRLNDNQMLYASIAKGEKAGGFNANVFNEIQRTYEPDENWTYELGSKNDLLGGRLRVNAAVFYTDWTDLQFTVAPVDIPDNLVQNPPGVVGNTNGAEIIGVEFDGTWFATDMLSFDYALSHTKAEYSNGALSGRLGLAGACDGIICPADGSIDGNQLQRQPETQASLSASLAGTAANNWEWYARADVNYQSKQYVDEFNLGWVPDRTLVNVRAELSNQNWRLSLWGKNIFDEEYGANSFATFLPT
ncbi:MAG: TonB-dependent receptor, partial [Chromatocurvus sp.]